MRIHTIAVNTHRYREPPGTWEDDLDDAVNQFIKEKGLIVSNCNLNYVATDNIISVIIQYE